uniref:CCHC-type domain-containing protein n=1 Tax=Tanacetum cinerariifolium TaxID=118510 RepID=A0A6L2MB32_TANCI|nr:hypothetical protein [Tanacetum cinerariifolium]
MDLETAQTTTTTKLPILKQGEYDIWRLRIEQYFQVQDYALWDVIKSGNSFMPIAQTTTNADGTSTTLISGPVTTEEKAQKKNDVKARSMLLMALPNEHLITYNQYKDAKTLFATIQTRFGGFKRLNKPDLDTMSFDDLYNNFEIVEQEVNGTVTSSSNSSSQNMAFVSSPSSTNEVNTTYGVNTANTQVSPASTKVSTPSTQDSTANLCDATVYAFLASQPNGNITINGSDMARYDKSKVKCFNCHKLGNFARECRQLRNHESRNRNQDTSRRTVNVKETASNAMVAIDGAATYKRGLASVEEQLDFYKKNEELQHPEFEGYGTKTSNSVSEDISNEVKESTDAPLVKELASDDKLEKKTVFPTVRHVNTAHPKTIVYSARPMSHFSKSAQSTGTCPISLISRNSIKDMLPLVEEQMVAELLKKRLLNPHNRKYIAPTLTPKLFSNMKRGFSREHTPLFPSMLEIQAEEGEGSGHPSEPQPPPSTAQPTNEEPIPNVVSSLHQETQTSRQALNKVTELPQTSKPIPNVADEAIYEEWDDRVKRATTTTASLDAERASGNINRTQSTTMPNVPLPQGIGAGGSPRCHKAMGVPLLRLENLDEEDPSKQERSMIEEINQDAGVTLVQIDVKDQGRFNDKTDFDAGFYKTYTRRRKVVSTGSGGISTASRLFSTAEELVSTAGASMPVSTVGMVQEVNISIPLPVAVKDKEWENIRARVKDDKELTQRLKAEERNKYSEVDQAKMLKLEVLRELQKQNLIMKVLRGKKTNEASGSVQEQPDEEENELS